MLESVLRRIGVQVSTYWSLITRQFRWLDLVWRLLCFNHIAGHWSLQTIVVFDLNVNVVSVLGELASNGVSVTCVSLVVVVTCNSVFVHLYDIFIILQSHGFIKGSALWRFVSFVGVTNCRIDSFDWLESYISDFIIENTLIQ
jgi:hypothetical protein